VSCQTIYEQNAEKQAGVCVDGDIGDVQNRYGASRGGRARAETKIAIPILLHSITEPSFRPERQLHRREVEKPAFPYIHLNLNESMEV